MKHLKLLALTFFIAFIGCDGDDDISVIMNDDMDDDIEIIQNSFDPNFTINFGTAITRDVFVTVVDPSNAPISGATVNIGNQSIDTDMNGIALLQNASLNTRFGYVKVNKMGFIHASRSIAPTQGTNVVTIMMLPETISGSTTSGEQKIITNSSGASVALNGEYINPDGSEYSGNVDVILHHLNPIDQDMPSQMPGMLYGQDADGNESGMQTFGMLAVELRGDNGEDLNLTPGSTATLSFPVDSSISSTAPATIPLWYFDEVNGVWIEEGQATLQGNMYVGDVSHFSFWNCDVPTNSGIICINVEDVNGDPLPNQEVQITSVNFGTTYGITNANGEVCGYMPLNETLDISLFTQGCGSTPIYTGTVGPFTMDDSVTITAVLDPVVISEKITGTLTDCNNIPVSNGYVQVEFLGETTSVLVESDGTFEVCILRCTNDDTFYVNGIDIDNLQETGDQNFTFTTPETAVGTIIACSTITEFIEYSIDNGASTYFSSTDISADFSPNNPNTGNPSVTISSFNSNTNDGFYMYGELNSAPYTGTYDFLDWNVLGDLGFNIEEFIGAMNNNTIMYNVTTFGNVGEYIDINFSGTFDQGGATKTLTGTVHVLRDN